MKRLHVIPLALIAVLVFSLLSACQPQAAQKTAEPAAPAVADTATSQPVEMEEPAMEATEPAAETAPQANGGTIVVGLSDAPVTLDPADHRSRQSETVIRNMFDGLVTRDTRSGVHLQLAESMDWTDDRTLDIKLRQGVKFHNGSEMTADDVVFTFERIINEK